MGYNRWSWNAYWMDIGGFSHDKISLSNKRWRIYNDKYG